MTGTDALLKDLQDRFPGWEVWVVPRAVDPPLWCARRWGSAVAVNERSDVDLAARLAAAERTA